MEMEIIAQGKNDPPQLNRIGQRLVDFTANQRMTVCVIEEGMTSGEPSVIILSHNEGLDIALQTSLDKFLTAASTMASLAEARWGWTRPEGHATIMPPSRQARREMLELIKHELEEYEEADDQAEDDTDKG